MKRYGRTKPSIGTLLNYGSPASLGLTGCWLLNEGRGDKTLDSTGYTNNGILTGFATPKTDTNGWNPGMLNGQEVTIAASTYVNIVKGDFDPGIQLMTKLTVICWFSLNANVSNGGLVHLGRLSGDQGSYALGFFQGQNNKLTARVDFNSANVNSTEVLSLNKLYCAAMTYDGSNCILYIDGRYQNQGAFGGPIKWNTVTQLHFGLYYSTGYCTRGPIESVFIYNRALTPLELTNHCKAPFAMFEK